MELVRLESLLKAGDWNIFTGWLNGMKGGKEPFHVTQGRCDDFGCSDECRELSSLEEVVAYLESTQHGEEE